MPARIAEVDWAAHPLGPRERWPEALQVIVDFVLASDVPMSLYWGGERFMIFNDAALPGFGARTVVPGVPGRDAWGDWWPAIDTRLREVEASGRSVTLIEVPFSEPGPGRIREIYWNLSFLPVMAQGGVAGIVCAAREVTEDVFARRHDSLMVELEDALVATDTTEHAIEVALRLIARELQAAQAGFGEIDDAGSHVEVKRVWSESEMADLRGRYPLGSFGDISASLARGETVVIDDASTDPRTAAPDVAARYKAMGLRAGLVIPIVEGQRYAGGVFVQEAVPREWTPFDIGLAEAATRRLWSAVARLRTATALKASEQRYRLIFEQAEDIIFTADIDQRITDCNAAGAKAMGVPREAIIGKSIADFVSSEGFAQTSAMLAHKLEHGGNTRHEVTVRTPGGGIQRWDNNSTLILDADRKPIGLLSISRDVTERRAFDERRELLIHELNHRVKNTLSLVQGLAHQSLRAGADPQAAAADFLSRLSALAVAHDLLTREQWEGVGIGELVRGATAHAAERIEAKGPLLLVSPKSAVALVMGIHELTTNAVKYGALSVPAGRVAVQWEARGPRFALRWEERGGPPVVPPDRRGFGVRMMERALASDLGGIVTIDFAPDGLVCTIDGPVLS